MNRKRSGSMFKNEIAEFIYKRTYSRWREDDKRREDWPETIERFLSCLISERKDIPDKTNRDRISHR